MGDLLFFIVIKAKEKPASEDTGLVHHQGLEPGTP